MRTQALRRSLIAVVLRGARRVNRVVEHALVVLFVSLLGVVVAAVISRYLVNRSLIWSEELARFLLLWIVFLAAGLGVARGVHVGTGTTLGQSRSAILSALQRAAQVAVIAFLALLLLTGIRFSIFMWKMEALLLPIPMGAVYLCLPVGAAVMLLNCLAAALGKVRRARPC